MPRSCRVAAKDLEIRRWIESRQTVKWRLFRLLFYSFVPFVHDLCKSRTWTFETEPARIPGTVNNTRWKGILKTFFQLTLYVVYANIVPVSIWYASTEMQYLLFANVNVIIGKIIVLSIVANFDASPDCFLKWFEGAFAALSTLFFISSLCCICQISVCEQYCEILWDPRYIL